MELLILAGGVILGASITTIIKRRYIIAGKIDIDHNTEQARVRFDNEKLNNRKVKKVILTVKHNAVISQEEHVL